DLAEARELHSRIQRRGGKRREERLRDHLASNQVGEPRRMREALEEQQLSLVGVEELLPEACRPRMRRGGVDRLAVIPAVRAGLLNADAALEVRIVLLVGE